MIFKNLKIVKSIYGISLLFLQIMNRKRYCIATVICIVASIISLFTISIRKHNYNASYSFDVNSIHMDIENRNVQLSMRTTKSIMCIFFNTECDFCSKEILYIKDNLDIFSRKYNLVLISFEDVTIQREQRIRRISPSV